MDGASAPEVVVCRLTPELLGDWLDFFDHEAFHDNPDWFGCYCQWFHVAPCDWEGLTVEDNRVAAIERIRRGELKGYLAYLAGRTVGWCQAAPRNEIPNIANDPALAVDDGDTVGSIVCFVVSAAARRMRVATKLLEAACEGFRCEGLQTAEAYPRAVAAGDAENYHGPLTLYLRAGFVPYREAGEVLIVRRALGEDCG